MPQEQSATIHVLHSEPNKIRFPYGGYPMEISDRIKSRLETLLQSCSVDIDAIMSTDQCLMAIDHGRAAMADQSRSDPDAVVEIIRILPLLLADVGLAAAKSWKDREGRFASRLFQHAADGGTLNASLIDHISPLTTPAGC